MTKRIAALMLCLIAAPACGTIFSAEPTPTPPSPTVAQPTALPTPSPTPAPALDPQAIWIGVEGVGDSMVAVDASGVARTVRLPLNEGQHASFVVASRDGRYVAYLVLNADGTPRGVAAWNPAEPNARLVAQPLEGYRIIGLYLADDSSGLAVVQVSAEDRLQDADWRIDRIPPQGGEPQLIAGRQVLDGAPPLLPFAWPPQGPLLLIPAGVQGVQAAIYAVNPQTGGGRLLFAPREPLVGTPALSPDGAHLAYLTAEDEGGATTAVRIHSLRLDETTALPAPPGLFIYGLRWLPDSKHLLLDVGASPLEDAAQRDQFWALATLDPAAPWVQSPPQAGRTFFDFEPYGAGVIYTTAPLEGEPWTLTILPDLQGAVEPLIVPLEALSGSDGLPAIIYTP